MNQFFADRKNFDVIPKRRIQNKKFSIHLGDLCIFNERFEEDSPDALATLDDDTDENDDTDDTGYEDTEITLDENEVGYRYMIIKFMIKYHNLDSLKKIKKSICSWII